MSRPQDKNLIPLTQRSEEEAHAIRSAGGRAAQEKRKQQTMQSYLLGKYTGLPIINKKTAKKFERMGFESEEITRALEITEAIFKGAKNGDPRMVEIYLKITGENAAPTPISENNLLSALMNTTKEDIATDDIPELLEAAESDADVVEQTDV